MDKERAIELIAGRITDEYRKHPSLDWAKIAASKLHSEWSEYHQSANTDRIRELEAEIVSYRSLLDDAVKEIDKLNPDKK